MAIVKADKRTKAKEGANTAQNDKYLEELKFIRNNTHKELKKYLALVEVIVATTPPEKWYEEYQGTDNKGNPIMIENRNIRIMDMARLLLESYETIMDAVCYVIYDYSMEYRISEPMSGGDMPNWMGVAKSG